MINSFGAGLRLDIKEAGSTKVGCSEASESGAQHWTIGMSDATIKRPRQIKLQSGTEREGLLVTWWLTESFAYQP